MGLQNKEAVLREILAEHASSGYALPPLEAEKNTFLQSIGKMIDRVVDMLPTFHIGDLVVNSSLALTVLIVLLTLFFFWVFFRFKRSVKFGMPIHQKGDRTPPASPNSLQDKLSEAIAAANWPRAMRLRWRVFLESTRKPYSLTPQMFLASHTENKELRFSARELYAAMFGYQTPDEDFYRHYSSFVDALQANITLGGGGT